MNQGMGQQNWTQEWMPCVLTMMNLFGPVPAQVFCLFGAAYLGAFQWPSSIKRNPNLK